MPDPLYIPVRRKPEAEDLSIAQTHDVLSRMTLCFPRSNDSRAAHVCLVTEDPPRWIHGLHDEAAVIARGM